MLIRSQIFIKDGFGSKGTKKTQKYEIALFKDRENNFGKVPFSNASSRYIKEGERNRVDPQGNRVISVWIEKNGHGCLVNKYHPNGMVMSKQPVKVE